MADWSTQASRDAHVKAGGYFAGPHQSYPLKDSSDVGDAWGLAGQADDPDQVRRNIVKWASDNGLTNALPDTAKKWAEDHNMELSDNADIVRHAIIDGMTQPDGVDQHGNHVPMTGSHTHHHSDGNGELHHHDHTHDGDNTHMHKHPASTMPRVTTPDIIRTMPSELTFYAPIVRIDKNKREVVVRATSEALDSYGTVFDFDGSKAAFAEWKGNIREMHQPKAVGRALEWHTVEEQRAIDVTLHISRGAEDTWQKLIEEPPTLVGASIGAKNGKWEKRTIDGEEIPVLTRYKLVELSLVDNPANPDCNIQIVRAGGIEDQYETTDVLEEEVEQATETRVGKPASATSHDDILNAILPDLIRAAEKTVGDSLNAPMKRLQAIAATLSQHSVDAEITRRVDKLDATLSEVRSLLSEVKATTESYAKRPMSGGPVVNSAGAYSQPQQLQPSQIAAQYAPFVELLQRQGILKDRQAILDANLLVEKIANGGR